MLPPELWEAFRQALLQPHPQDGIWTIRNAALWLSERLGRPVDPRRAWNWRKRLGFAPSAPDTGEGRLRAPKYRRERVLAFAPGERRSAKLPCGLLGGAKALCPVAGGWGGEAFAFVLDQVGWHVAGRVETEELWAKAEARCTYLQTQPGLVRSHTLFHRWPGGC